MSGFKIASSMFPSGLAAQTAKLPSEVIPGVDS